MKRANALVLILTLTAVACGGREGTRSATPDSASATGMGAMAMRSDTLIGPMRAHLDSLAGASGPALAAALPAHEARASTLLDAMGADMAAMGMRADSAWSALTDSVRRDLAGLPGLSGRELERRVAGHVGRLGRLLDRHEAMMRGM